MHILKNLNKIFFWTDYFIQDCQIRRKIEKLKKEDADFSKEEAFLRNKMLRYCRLAYPDYYKYYGLTGDEKLEEFPLISKRICGHIRNFFVQNIKSGLHPTQRLLAGVPGIRLALSFPLIMILYIRNFYGGLWAFKKGTRLYVLME